MNHNPLFLYDLLIDKTQASYWIDLPYDIFHRNFEVFENIQELFHEHHTH